MLGAIASRQKPLVAFYNLQNGPGLRGFVQSQCFQKRGKFSNQARCSYTFLKIFKVATKRGKCLQIMAKTKSISDVCNLVNESSDSK
jgi:hypothetical protein